jgi:hypothetical protein
MSNFCDVCVLRQRGSGRRLQVVSLTHHETRGPVVYFETAYSEQRVLFCLVVDVNSQWDVQVVWVNHHGRRVTRQLCADRMHVLRFDLHGDRDLTQTRFALQCLAGRPILEIHVRMV